MTSYASEKRAPGNCDRCGLRYPLKMLKREFVAGSRQNLRVCPSCYDKDHPQNWQGKLRFVERMGLKDPRPDSEELAQIRSLPGWAPVGNEAVRLRSLVGQVHVRIG